MCVDNMSSYSARRAEEARLICYLNMGVLSEYELKCLGVDIDE